MDFAKNGVNSQGTPELHSNQVVCLFTSEIDRILALEFEANSLSEAVFDDNTSILQLLIQFGRFADDVRRELSKVRMAIAHRQDAIASDQEEGDRLGFAYSDLGHVGTEAELWGLIGKYPETSDRAIEGEVA